MKIELNKGFKCTKCGKTTKLIMKMGGLICGSCRVILFLPYAEDGVYDREFKATQEKMKNEHVDLKAEMDALRKGIVCA